LIDVTRSLPERTVEAWVTAYIVRWFPTAELWAPTQRDPRRWDMSARIRGGIHFVFEYKGVEAYRGPYVPINPDQLNDYVALNSRMSSPLVWYLLPTWTYDTGWGQVLPTEAATRTIRANDPRPRYRGGWELPDPPTVPPEIPDFRDEMEIGRGCEAFFYVCDPARIRDSNLVQAFGGRSHGVPVQLIPDLAEGLTLEHFMVMVGRSAAGVGDDEIDRASESADEIAVPKAEPLTQATWIRVTPTGAALSFAE
jgi:hypothetical protein